MLNYALRERKEDIRRLEVVKLEFIKAHRTIVIGSLICSQQFHILFT